MTDEFKQRLADVKILISMKQVFLPHEAKIIFDLHNEITGKNLPITRCASCVNTVLSVIKKAIRDNAI